MNDYYEIATSIFIDYGVRKEPKLPVHISFLSGQPINSPLPELVFEVNFPADAKLPHFLDGCIPLVSQYFIDVIKRSGMDNFQVFPVSMINPDLNEHWHDYYAFNVVGLCKAINIQASEGDELIPGDAAGENLPLIAFRNIVLDRDSTMGHLMFRPAESPDVLLMHQDMVDLLKANKPDDGWGIRISKCVVNV